MSNPSDTALALAQERGYQAIRTYSGWRNYIVFKAIQPARELSDEEKQFKPLILANRVEARWATAEEYREIMEEE